MNFRVKTLLATVATTALLISGFSAPAQATGEALNIATANDTFTGSSISGFDPNAMLRLSLVAELGTLTWTNNGSGASLQSFTGETSSGIMLEGTQDQLNLALSEVKINQPCSGNYKIYAQVTDSIYLKDPVSGHLYSRWSSFQDFEPAIATAAATPLISGATNTYGYLATVTSEVEGKVISSIFGSSWLGASDRANEGDWKWVTGPEAGTSFYSGRGDQGGMPVNGMYAGWAYLEPNDYNNNEDFAEIMQSGGWNDVNNGWDHSYTIEWGGMPGDDLSAITVASDTLDITVQGALTGAGTSADPYLVADVAGLRAVNACGGENVYFKQTANISLPSDWAGDQEFIGHYDGNGKTIAFAKDTLVTHSTFGIWSQINQWNSEISNLTVSGDIISTSFARVGLIVGQGYGKLTNVTVSGSITTSDGRYSTGGMAGEFGGEITNGISTVNLYSTSDGSSFGGLVGYFYGTMTKSSWSGEMNISGTGNTYSVGGLVGDTDCAEIRTSKASGTITISNIGTNIGGLSGFFCGTTSDSYANVDIVAADSVRVGGASGYADGDFQRVGADGDVTASDEVGGLFGFAAWNQSSDLYAHGNVFSLDRGGSLIGEVQGYNLVNAYATGSVTALTSRGLYGQITNSQVYQTHWVPEQSTIPVPDPLESGEVPYTAADSKSIDYYTADGWNISSNWDDGAVWTICPLASNGYPILTSHYEEDPCLLAQTLSPTPTITGSGYVGAALTGVPGTWDAGTTQTFAWLVDNQVVAGETATTYTPAAGDLGKTVQFRVISTKSGYREITALSTGKIIKEKPVPPVKTKETSISIGGFVGDSWWAPAKFPSGVLKFAKSHKTAKAITCVGIVAPGGSPAWQKTLGLKRAQLACSYLKVALPKVKFKLTWQVAKKSDAVLRGVKLIVTK